MIIIYLSLTQFGTQFCCQIVNKFLHDSVNLFVIQCFFFVLKNEIYGVTLLSIGQVLALIHVEKDNITQKFLLRLAGYLLYLRKLHALIKQQREVTANGRVLVKFLEHYLVFLDSLHDTSPIKFRIVHVVVDIQLA